MKIEFKKSLLKDLEKIPYKIKIKLKQQIEELEESDNLFDMQNIKALKNHKGYYRLKMGSYRLGFVFQDDVVTLVRFLHRKDIYKLFP